MINRIIFHLYYGLFWLLARIFPATPIPLRGTSFARILVFSAAGIGDTLTDSVALRALKETFPLARLSVVTHRRRQVLARHNPFVDEIIPYHKSLLNFPLLAFRLHRRHFHLIVMLRGNDPDLWPLAWLANRHAVVSCPIMTRFKFLISHPVQIPEWDRTHGVEQTLKIVRSVGAEVSDPRLVYQVREEEREALRRKLEFSEIHPVVVFQVGGGRRSAWRDWPVEHYLRLGEKLLKSFDVRLVLLGGRDLVEKAAAIQSGLPSGTLNLAGKLSLAESAALLSLSKILVSTDTGIMHLGFAVGVDTLALIHCNNPSSRVGPFGYGEKHRVVQLEPPPGMAVSRNVDMVLMSPDRVWRELDALCRKNGLKSQES